MGGGQEGGEAPAGPVGMLYVAQESQDEADRSLDEGGDPGQSVAEKGTAAEMQEQTSQGGSPTKVREVDFVASPRSRYNASSSMGSDGGEVDSGVSFIPWKRTNAM